LGMCLSIFPMVNLGTGHLCPSPRLVVGPFLHRHSPSTVFTPLYLFPLPHCRYGVFYYLPDHPSDPKSTLGPLASFVEAPFSFSPILFQICGLISPHSGIGHEILDRMGILCWSMNVPPLFFFLFTFFPQIFLPYLPFSSCKKAYPPWEFVCFFADGLFFPPLV